MKKIGVSLPLALLSGKPASAAQEQLLVRGGEDTAATMHGGENTAAAVQGGVSRLLERLKAQGVISIEIRTIRADTPIEDVAAAVQAIHSAGLGITAHGELNEGDQTEFFAKLKPIMALQGSCTVTAHPIKGLASDAECMAATYRALDEVSAYMVAHHPCRITLALENNRIKGLEDVTHAPAGVLAALDHVQNPQIGACWDFGHLYSDHIKFGVPVLPPEEYPFRAVHTHIHALNGRTHFPLSKGELPLSEYIGMLKQAGYAGIYNLELEPERWPEEWGDPLEYYLTSIELLGRELDEIPELPRRALCFFGSMSGTEPYPGRHHCGWALKQDAELYWFDAGEASAHTAYNLGLDLRTIRAIFISHPHMDHIGGLGNLLWYMRKVCLLYKGKTPAVLKLFMPDAETWPALLTLLRQTEGDFVCPFEIDEKRVADGFEYKDENIRVTALHNTHLPRLADGTYRSFSYKIELGDKTVVFTGDVKSLTEIAPLLDGTDVLIAETGHHHPLKLIRELNALKRTPLVYLIHHGRAILEHGERAVDMARREYAGRIVMLNDGDVYEV